MSAQINNPTRISHISRIDIPQVLAENGEPDPKFEAHSAAATHGGLSSNPEFATWEDVQGSFPQVLEERAKEVVKEIANARRSLRDGTDVARADYREIITQMGLDREGSGLAGYVFFNPRLVVFIYEDDMGAHDARGDTRRMVPYVNTAGGKSQIATFFRVARAATADLEKESGPEERRILSVALSKLARIGYPRAGLDEGDATVRGLFRLEEDFQSDASGMPNAIDSAIAGRGYYTATELRLFRNARARACDDVGGREDARGERQVTPPFTEDAERYEALIIGQFSDMLVTLDVLKVFAGAGACESYSQAFIIGIPLYVEVIKRAD